MKTQIKSKSTYTIIKQGGRFIVARDGEPIKLPKGDGSFILASFDTNADAKGYIFTLKNVIKEMKAGWPI